MGCGPSSDAQAVVAMRKMRGRCIVVPQSGLALVISLVAVPLQHEMSKKGAAARASG